MENEPQKRYFKVPIKRHARDECDVVMGTLVTGKTADRFRAYCSALGKTTAEVLSDYINRCVGGKEGKK